MSSAIQKASMRAYYAKHTESFKLRGHAYRERHKQRLQVKRASIDGRTSALLGNARREARVKGLPFDLTTPWVRERIIRGFCEVTGLPFDLRPALGSGCRGSPRNPFAPSLDRILVKGGYTQDNVQVVVWIHNTARGDWGDGPVQIYARAVLGL